MEELTQCTQCKTEILVRTAARNEGRCIPCANGTREDLESAKQYYKRERELDATDPLRLYWRQLVRRVHSPGPEDRPLDQEERVYYAISVLIGETLNGGFHQFFSNSSGEYYYDALSGLEMIQAHEAKRILLAAKNLLFGSHPVPVNTEERRRVLEPSWDVIPEELSELGDRLCEGPDSLLEKLDLMGMALARNERSGTSLTLLPGDIADTTTY